MDEGARRYASHDVGLNAEAFLGDTIGLLAGNWKRR